MIKLLLYKGLGTVSKAIRAQTRSDYSHAAAFMDDDYMLPNGEMFYRGSTWEAWHVGGERRWDNVWMGAGQVRRLSNPWIDHDLDTEIEVWRYKPGQAFDIEAAVRYLESQVGKEYDFRNVFRFVSRRDAADNNKLFCSEYFSNMSNKAGVRLLNLHPAHTAPCHLSWTPLMEYERTIRKGRLR